jgi:hypothetical protein
MKRSLKDRFREVDLVPTPWDEAGADAHGVTVRSRSRRGVTAFALVAAALAIVAAVAVVVARPEASSPTPDASWLVSDTQASCIEQYSPQTLPNRDWAFDGVIETVENPADPHSEDPGQTTTTVTFDVARWFWGGSGKQISLQTYAGPSSAGDVEESIGSHLLVSGDEDFLWLCGFTQPFSAAGEGEFEAAAAGRSQP